MVSGFRRNHSGKHAQLRPLRVYNVILQNQRTDGMSMAEMVYTDCISLNGQLGEQVENT
ncbi:MAG: hypothetical protein HW390_2838 [Candidatus Brocadiaceae bacterium]|nr:hypothetical protein [Candidatus Brocadiaceae bacterium]